MFSIKHSQSRLLILIVSSYLLLWCSFVVLGKLCSDRLNDLSVHTFRYELSSSKNITWKNEMMSHYNYHLNPTDESAWTNLLPTRKLLKEEDEAKWVKLYRSIKYSDKNAKRDRDRDADNTDTKWPLKEVSLHDVKLVPDSLYWRAQQTNLEYMLMLEVDSLVWNFRKQAGLPTPGYPYGGWEAPNVELRGHFTGHYLSGSARLWATTKDATLKEKMDAIVSALHTCQKKIGTGYLSAFPTQFFDKFEQLQPIWAPYYTIHKIMAGLLDQYMYTGNFEALDIAERMAAYFYNRVENVIRKYTVDYHYATLNEETGGMNDVMYNLYRLTADPRHLTLGQLFDKPCFLGLLAVKVDDIAGFHANTHIPIVIGAQSRYEVNGEPLYKEMSLFFMDIVNSSHAYPTGGTSVNEHWTDTKRLATNLTSENEETCTTYNMLKVSRTLFRWTREMVYADYYERALTNGILSVQRGVEPGVMIYMLPMQPGGSKARSKNGWGTKFDSFWCCYGTGIESFSKLGDSIYFEEEEEGETPELYVNQYIQSSFDWKLGRILLNQKVEPVVSWDPRLQATLTISPSEPPLLETNLNLRIPTWAYGGSSAKAFLNNQTLSPIPGEFLSITRKWNTGDKITLELPLSLRTEAIKDDRPEYASLQAILYGPYLVVGLSFGDWNLEIEPGKSPSDWITPISKEYNSNLITLSQQQSGNENFVLAKTKDSIIMKKKPKPRTDAAANSTFRLIPHEQHDNFSSPIAAIGKLIALEPYNLPGSLLVHQGKDQSLSVGDASTYSESALFFVLAGLDGNNETISLESKLHKGCYICSDLANTKQSGAHIKLSCESNSSVNAASFKQAASFKLEDGISKYDPISFIAKGKNRSFLLSPLFSLRDESYTVYFNVTSSIV